MSILSIDKTDFKGVIKLSNSSVNYKLDEMIDQIEYNYLNDLLGPTLYEEFKAALSSTPAAKWTDLRDGKIYTIGDNDFKTRFVGVKEMCLYFIYAETLINDLENSPEGSGDFDSINTKSVSRNRIQNESNSKFNIGANYYNDAIKFIRENITDYDEFNPKFIQYR